ncbi:MAG: serine/threonine-protein kinase [Dehalococcoidia bacterium]
MMEQPPIGRYQVLEEIASGGQGSVYRAFDPQSGQIVALKVLHPGLTADANYLERFRREARMAASIDHPNVVRVFEVGEAGGQHFIAMEFLPESLARIVETAGPLPVQRAVQFGLQIAEGLAAAHELGIVHRDVKPQNVLIGANGEAKVTDFGIARAQSFSTMTEVGMLMGTPYYMSPEQSDGKQADTRSDVYSFGCLLYQMLTGELPFRGSTPMEVLRKHREEPPPSVRDQRRDIPPELVRAVEQCLAKRPEHRYQSMSRVVAALGGTAPGPVVLEEAPVINTAPVDTVPEVAPQREVEVRQQPPDRPEPPVSASSDRAFRNELRSRALQHPATILPLAVAALCAIYLLVFPYWILPPLMAGIALIAAGLVGAGSFAWIYFVRRDAEYAKLVREMKAQQGQER